jgi:hypothetical protein
MNQLTKQNQEQGLSIPSLPGLPSFQSFDELSAVLSAEPNPEKIEKLKFKGNSEALVISEVEATLDSIFGAMNWQTSNFSLQMIGGSAEKGGQAYYYATITLSVLHPLLRVWITRDGSHSGYVEHKTIPTFAAAAKSLALKNAAKTLGEVFGRDLNRKITSDILDQNTEDYMVGSGLLDTIMNAESKHELIEIRNNLQPAMRGNAVIRAALNDRAKALKEKEDGNV